jgi:transcriptional regulator with XRE-family HTH domain/Zn-dependent peptidase ImmA (M78 family)
MDRTPTNLIGRRLKALREDRRLTQSELADLLGLAHRQSLASIEAGERAVSAEELARSAEALRVDVSAFTDPFQLIGEGDFSFRADGVAPEALDEFQQRAGRWVATYRTLLDRAGVPRSRLGCKLELRQDSSYEEAQAAAEELRREWHLGDVPAEVLVGIIERELGARVLFVDAPRNVSVAAVHLPGLHTILVNRHEPPGRRNFDIAHELFHLLTWDAMAPDRVEPREVPRRKGNRVERLAENFAGALLMPADLVTRRWQERGDSELLEWLVTVGGILRVTPVALKWRLVVLGHLSRAQADAIDDRRLAANGGGRSHTPPLPFDRELVERVHAAIEEGYLSLGRATRLLAMTARDFAELCTAYGLALSYEV